VAYARHLYLVCTVCDFTIWRHARVSKPTFWRNFLTQYVYYSARTLFILCEVALNLNYQGSKLWYQKEIHSRPRYRRSERQKEAALMFRRIRAVKHRRCVTGMADAHPGLQDRILLNCPIIENACEVRKKNIFCFVQKSTKRLVLLFLFLAERLSNAWMLRC